jgi:hypothetical protein
MLGPDSVVQTAEMTEGRVVLVLIQLPMSLLIANPVNLQPWTVIRSWISIGLIP